MIADLKRRTLNSTVVTTEDFQSCTRIAALRALNSTVVTTEDQVVIFEESKYEHLNSTVVTTEELPAGHYIVLPLPFKFYCSNN